MAKARKQKEQEVKKLTDNLKNAKSVVFTTFQKLSVADLQELRRKLREEKISYQVCKKTLLKKALAETESESFAVDELTDNTGLAASAVDEVMPAKVLTKFMASHEQLQIIGGYLDKQLITREKIKELASLPTKLELIAKTVGTIKAPLNGLVNVLIGNLRGLVNVLNAIRGNK